MHEVINLTFPLTLMSGDGLSQTRLSWSTGGGAEWTWGHVWPGAMRETGVLEELRAQRAFVCLSTAFLLGFPSFRFMNV